MNTLRLAVVSCLFLGCSPFAPGTVGTLGGVAIAWLLRHQQPYLLWIVVCALIIYLVGRSLGTWAEAHAGKDPGIFVLDEVIGYLITVAWTGAPSPLTLIVAFFVFRFFDIFKPPLARRMEKIGGGDGILLDDVVSGFYGLILVMLPLRLFVDLPWSLSPGGGG
ncbi:MAG TPA: phosphatidylglycerophosphatase A [Planctomycetota bacterium]|jgi:phosphatidylglycerophosphatase A|nr:phosphatidylglycerophosphatase A [Planctomycetota bacterium]